MRRKGNIHHWPVSGPPLYLGGLSFLAMLTGIPYFLFPELAALHYDVLSRPEGAWAKRIEQVVVSPTLAALIGWSAGRLLGYAPWVAVLAALGAMLLLLAFRSPVIPAISAGVLPVVLRVQSIWYVPAILLGTGLMALSFLRLRQRLVAGGDGAEEPTGKRRLIGYPATLLFVLLGAWLAPDLATIFPPPLAVMAFELFTRPHAGWGKRPTAFFGCLVLVATLGFLAGRLVPFAPLAVVLVLAVGILLLRRLDYHLAPALAVGVLPILVQPGPWYIIMVGGGAAVALAGNYGWRYLEKHSIGGEIGA